MKINWFTVIAQVVNFLILVWLMKRFLYKPVLNAIDEREKKIALQLAEADAKQAEATIKLNEFKEKNEQFEREVKDMKAKAIEETNLETKKLVEEARNNAATLLVTEQKSMDEKTQQINRLVIEKTQREIFATSKKLLNDLAGLPLEEQIAGQFVKRIKELDDAGKKNFITSFKTGNPVGIVSAFSLGARMQSVIEDAVWALLGDKIPVQFTTNPDLISGIEMSAGGFKVAWSITDYLDKLESNLSNATGEISKSSLPTQ